METSKKTCFKCLCEKPLSEFYKHKMMADGHLNKCKECTKVDVRKHREENLDQIRAYDRSRGMLPHRVAARAEYATTEAAKEIFRKAHKKYVENNRERRSKTTRDFYQRNKESHKIYAKEYVKKNIERVRVVKAANENKRRASKLLRMPSWLTDHDLLLIRVKHAEARWMTIRTGIRHHVDHIIPLQGRTVSGLHVPWNLRVIPARENIKKSNTI